MADGSCSRASHAHPKERGVEEGRWEGRWGGEVPQITNKERGTAQRANFLLFSRTNQKSESLGWLTFYLWANHNKGFSKTKAMFF
jgi:hypothetical protein